MRDFNNYLPEDAIEENLKENTVRREALEVQEKAHLYELAEVICRDLEDRSHWLEALPDRAPILAQGEAEDVCRRSMELCGLLAETMLKDHALSLSFFFQQEPDGSDAEKSCRIAYQKNSYADEAYLRFSAHLEDPRVAYTHSFIAACEDVYNGISDYCILPVESSFEGHLGSFARLIHRFDLKIVATCDISGNDGERFTRYALLGRQVRPLLPLGTPLDYLEFSLPLSGDPATASVLRAAEYAGLELTRLNCLPEQETSDMTVHFQLRLHSEGLYPYLLYLFMQAPHFTPIGIYNQI